MQEEQTRKSSAFLVVPRPVLPCAAETRSASGAEMATDIPEAGRQAAVACSREAEA